MSSTSQAPILVGVDEKGTPEAALRFALAEAEVAARRIRLLHVVTLPWGPDSDVGPLVDVRPLHEEGHALLDATAEHARAMSDNGVEVETAVEFGSPVEALVKMGERCDLIVVQRRSLSGLQRVFTGSVVNGVAGRATVPVASVPERWQAPLDRPRITVGVDAALSEPHLVHHAFRTAERMRGTVKVLHAWWVPWAVDGGGSGRIQVKERTLELERQIERRLDRMRGEHPYVPVQVEVVHERAADALTRASEQSAVVAVGRPGTSERLSHLGSLARALIREAACPVEVVPTRVPRHLGRSQREERSASVAGSMGGGGDDARFGVRRAR